VKVRRQQLLDNHVAQTNGGRGGGTMQSDAAFDLDSDSLVSLDIAVRKIPFLSVDWSKGKRKPFWRGETFVASGEVKFVMSKSNLVCVRRRLGPRSATESEKLSTMIAFAPNCKSFSFVDCSVSDKEKFPSCYFLAFLRSQVKPKLVCLELHKRLSRAGRLPHMLSRLVFPLTLRRCTLRQRAETFF
jgi:hypothetical protein